MAKIILALIAVLVTVTFVYAGSGSGRECREINGRLSCVKTNDSEGR